MTPLSALALAAGASLATFGVVCLVLARRDAAAARRAEAEARVLYRSAVVRSDKAAVDRRIAQQRFEDAARMAHPTYSPYPDNWNR